MATLIKSIRKGGKIEFSKGKFDDWCVYLETPEKARYAPTDSEYFGELSRLGKKYGHEKIYNDFIKVYAVTDKNIDINTLKLIEDIADTYNEDANVIEIWLAVIYGGMIAEENKAYAILKKRVKG